MQVKVLKPFGYSEDGRFTEKKTDGDAFGCRDDIAQSLIDEGYVEPDAPSVADDEAPEKPKSRRGQAASEA